MPKISALMPIYKTNPEHLRAAVASVLAQTYTDFELLILNDSPEDTELDAVIASFADTRIRYFANAGNLGASPPRATG